MSYYRLVKNQLALCSRKHAPATAAMRTYITPINCPPPQGLWRRGVTGEELVNTQYFTAVQRGQHASAHPRSLFLSQTPIRARGCSSCRLPSKCLSAVVKEEPRGGGGGVGGNCQHVGGFIHVQRRVITSHMSPREWSRFTEHSSQ